MSPTNRWVIGRRLRPPGSRIAALTPHGVVLVGTGGEEPADGANSGASDGEIFVYTGEAGPPVPRDAVRVRVHESVASIPQGAFMDCLDLEQIELPHGLREIGAGAFAFCIALKRIAIPSTVVAIGPSAFFGCEELSEVGLCEGGLRKIEFRSFANCFSLERIKVPSTVAVIAGSSFSGCESLREVELFEGLGEIGRGAFFLCCSLRNIEIPASVTKIGEGAFHGETGGYMEFNACNFPKFRFPPLVGKISTKTLSYCVLFSAELPESVGEIESRAFKNCRTLRNVAIPCAASLTESIYDTIEESRGISDAFLQCADLKQLFGPDVDIMSALKHRFDGHPIHELLYYQSYNCLTVKDLSEAIDKNQHISSSFGQDCLGMTLLHVLACSTTQSLGLYQVIIGKFPEFLIAKDGWGTLPLLYVIWGGGPNSILQFLVGTHLTLYPTYEFDWSNMFQTLGRGNAPFEVIQTLLHVQQKSFPEQIIDWKDVLDKRCSDYVSVGTFCSLVKCSIAIRQNAIGVKKWRDDISEKLQTKPKSYLKTDWLSSLSSKLEYYELEYQKLKEITTILELALWRAKIIDYGHDDTKRRHSIFKLFCIRQGKRAKMDELRARKQCRINCGAGIVVGHVVSFLYRF